MDIVLSSNIEGISWEELARLFERAPLGKRREPQMLEMAFRNSSYSCFASLGSMLVGLGGPYPIMFGAQLYLMWLFCQNIRERGLGARLFNI